MSLTDVSKKRLTDDENVKAVVSLAMGEDDGLAAMEIALMELAVMSLHANRKAIEAGSNPRSETKKLYRAIAKSVMVGKMSPETATELIKHLGGPEGDEDHPSGTSQDVHSGRKQSKASQRREAKRNKTRDANLRQAQKEAEARAARERVEAFPEVTPTKGEVAEAATKAALKFVDDEKTQGAMRSYLQSSSIGTGIMAVVDYFSQAGGKYQFAARAISEFGPIAGARMAHTYFRYGGYDVPMKQKGDHVVTEMGDRLPEPGSLKKTRTWAIDTLKKRLPGRSADDSGAEPPSEGFIIDKKGNVLAHGVGRGNDNFLPFNSRHLKKLRQEEGVEYVRRRMFGGPTSEDLHAAMLMGADRVTVVSNGGIFTIELKKRSHGIKMEHGQILSRYQEILDEKGRLDFRSYNSALDALQSEFPLHFQKEHAARGDWADDDDRILPKERFGDQLRKMFSALSGGTTSEAPEPQKTQRGLPGLRTGENTKQWYQRQISQGNMSRQQAFQLAVGRIRETGGDVNSQWIREERQRIQQGRPTLGAQSTVKTPSTTPDWGRVETRRIDPATQAAQRAQPQQARFTVGVRARERFEALGLDHNGYSTANSAHARKLAEMAQVLPQRAWEDALDNRDLLDDFAQTFNQITTR